MIPPNIGKWGQKEEDKSGKPIRKPKPKWHHKMVLAPCGLKVLRMKTV